MSTSIPNIYYCSLRTSDPNISIPACKKVITFVLYYTHLRFFIARIFCRHISRLFDIVTVHSVTSNTLRNAQKDEPSFRDAKVVFSVYEDDFKSTLSDDFAAKLMLKGISKKDLGDLKEPVDYAALCKLAVDYSDGVIQNSEKVDESIIEYARQSGKLVLDYQNPENYADACNEFYDQVWDATANEEE